MGYLELVRDVTVAGSHLEGRHVLPACGFGERVDLGDHCIGRQFWDALLFPL